MPAGVAVPSGAIRMTSSPTRAASALGQRIAEDDAIATIAQGVDAAALDALRQAHGAPLLAG